MPRAYSKHHLIDGDVAIAKVECNVWSYCVRQARGKTPSIVIKYCGRTHCCRDRRDFIRHTRAQRCLGGPLILATSREIPRIAVAKREGGGVHAGSLAAGEFERQIRKATPILPLDRPEQGHGFGDALTYTETGLTR